MLTVEEIEKSNFSVNDVADLMMRYQKAYKTIEFIVTELMKVDNPSAFTKSAYEAGVDGLDGMEKAHDCEVVPNDKGAYQCNCDLRGGS